MSSTSKSLSRNHSKLPKIGHLLIHPGNTILVAHEVNLEQLQAAQDDPT